MSGKHAALAEEPGKVAATYRLSQDVHEALRRAAFDRRVSQNDIVDEALRALLGLREEGGHGSHEKAEPGAGGGLAG